MVYPIKAIFHKIKIYKVLIKNIRQKEGIKMNKEMMWEILLNSGVSEQTLQVVTDINGYTESSMHDILYAVFGLRNFDDLN